MSSKFNTVPHISWSAARSRRLHELIIIQILKLTDDEVRRVRRSGFVFANLSDIVCEQMNESTVRITFGTWEKMGDVEPFAGREWLMAFDYAVGYLGAPGEMELDDPSEHPWNDDFDLQTPPKIRAILIQFVIDMDPVSVVAHEMVHRVFNVADTSTNLLGRDLR